MTARDSVFYGLTSDECVESVDVFIWDGEEDELAWKARCDEAFDKWSKVATERRTQMTL